ncbi:MAG: hypothetical protein Fur0043_13540 [Anaerolineales bacterium]
MQRMENQPSSTPLEDTVTFKRSHFYAVMTLFAFAAGMFVGYLIWGRNVPAAVPSAAKPAQAPAEQPAYTRYEIPTDGFPSIGPEDAEIVIVEFSDFECPFCKRWHDQTYRPLMEAYPGKIRLVYRNLPLPELNHTNAVSAAEAAMCAGDQQAFWEFHDKLFSDEYGLGEEAYLKYAADLGLDVDAFTECITSRRHQEFVEKDRQFSKQLGVTGTPTFFINGLAIVGAQPLQVFQQVIDQELAGEIPQ